MSLPRRPQNAMPCFAIYEQSRVAVRERRAEHFRFAGSRIDTWLRKKNGIRIRVSWPRFR